MVISGIAGVGGAITSAPHSQLALLAGSKRWQYSLRIIRALDEVLSATPKLHPEAGVQRVGGRLLAAGPDDFLHTFEDEQGEVSEVAERIVELANGSRTVAQIVDALCSEYDVDEARCRADTVEFLKLLVTRQLMVFA